MAEHILLVDDNEDFRSAAREFFSSNGYRVSAAPDGQAALELVAQQPPDIILLDVMMPRMDGWETLKILQDDEQTADIPVLMLTAVRGSESVKKSFDRGSVWYYSKPITDHHDLLLVIRRILDQQG